MEEKNIFDTLNAINVNEHTESKNGLTYLSWAWAWAEVKKNFPFATYTIYENVNPQGHTCNYFTDGRTCWVKTGLTINGLEYIEELPVMDFHNKSILLNSITSFDVNKAIQRSLTKAAARHGLGLYIYAGEDIPEEDDTPAFLKEEKKDDNMITENQKKKLYAMGITDDQSWSKFTKNIDELTKKQASALITEYSMGE